MRVVPVDGRPVFVQPTFQWRSGTAPTLMHVSVYPGDSVRTGPTLLAALGGNAASRLATASAPRDTKLRADSLYRVMREALSHGDWTAFGHAFDALGVALRVTN